MEWGESEKTLITAAKKFGKTPPALLKKPRLNATGALYLEFFTLLFSGEAIPLTDIIILCDLRGFEDKEKMVVILKALEKIVIQHQNKQISNDNSKTRR